MKIELTEEEGNKLVMLIDDAVRHKGLSVAGIADYFFNKLKLAIIEEKNNKQLIDNSKK